MKSSLTFLILLLFLVTGNLLNAQYENIERIISFNSNITLNEDASMEVLETIQVYANGNKIKRGIYRDFPTKYKDDYGNNVKIRFDILEVLRDGSLENYHTEKLSNGVRVYFGRSDYFLPAGKYTYTFKYRTDRQIGYFDKFDELYWNVTGNGWEFLIEKASAIVNFPEPVSSDDLKLFAYTGYSGFKAKDFKAEIIDFKKVQFETTHFLAPKEGLTIVVNFPKGLIYEPALSDKVKYFIQDNLHIVLGLIGIIIILLYYLIIWIRVGKDPSRGLIIPLYEPPSGISPAAARFIMEMGYDDKIFTSAIVSLAVKGFLIIEEDGKDYTLVKSKSNKPLTGDESAVFNKLSFQNKNGKQILEIEQKNHTILQSAIKGLKNSLKNSFEKSYFLTNMKYFVVGIIISIIVIFISNIQGSGEQLFALVWVSIWSFGVTALLFSVYKAWKGALNKRRGKVTALGGAIFITIFSIPFIAGEIAGLYLFSYAGSPIMIIIVGLVVVLNIVFYHLLKAPTLLGRRLMDKIEGFKMYLGVAEKDRLDSLKEPQKTPELFELFLPYALALNVENQWAEKFSDILSVAGQGSSVYKPGWYSGTSWSTLGASGFASSLSSSFSSSVSSSSTAPGSSSGSGGGGSSGGGGGGGGGGGW
jgi:uncharacterized membrane protein